MENKEKFGKNLKKVYKGNTESKRKNVVKIAIILLILIVVSILLIFFIKSNYKNQKFGNNMSNKNIEDFEEYILNISSYEANIEVIVESNKNKNKYVIEQKYKAPNISEQKVLQPSNIEGLETKYDGSKLIISNSKTNATTIYENYPYIVDNFLWLNSFVQDYINSKNTGNTSIKEENGQIIMETKIKNEDNKYISNKKLYIDRNTGKPSKLLIQDINKNNLVYILYNEIMINGLQ